ncbi:hypothetical protein NEOLEDRAFT_1087697 [Neolentinus lepideus HHB14362 ss-1]|uniref:Gti1/Pac2 family protein n=1 Tax=Neolentinus lepideus HHB14362 ss-1 TaxID=1314782 RepID=A0A165UFR7_9AGAM|nr:hypothetical protein NEOLEDRAFT_1087697 [Neolentinus lepideus HHB14362 ss-1]
MQQPTLENVCVRTVRDATHIFYAVARNLLPIITRRLDADERRAIKAGNVYVWEDRGANSESSGLGMERWTDGMSWGPSRVRDEFLYYTQKEYDPENESSASWVPALRRRDPTTSGANSSDSHPLGGSRSSRRPEHLMKQTYSVHVFLPQDRAQGTMRKWHLTAYFSQETVDSLTPVSALPGIGDVTVPEGWFRSARSSKTRRGASSMSPSTPANNPSDDSLPRSLRSDETPLEGVDLVPLEYLQNKSCPPRDPADQEMMRRLGVLCLGIPANICEAVGLEQPSL